MLILALDTSGGLVGAAVHDGTRVLAERGTPDPRHHAELLAPAVTGVLAEAGADRSELTGIAVGVGPGPFTGLRVGLVTARVLGWVLGIPVHGICSLDALALGAAAAAAVPPGSEFLVATDARRREVYWARYRQQESAEPGVVRVAGPSVQAPATVPRDGLPVVGRGAAVYPELLGPALEPLDVTAGQVAQLAVRALAGRLGPGGPGLLPPDPLYLRRPDAAEAGPRKRVRTGITPP